MPNNEKQHREIEKLWYSEFPAKNNVGLKVFGRQEAYTDQKCQFFILIPSHENLFFVLQV